MKKAYEDTIKKTNVCIVEVPEGKEKNRGLVVDSCQCMNNQQITEEIKKAIKFSYSYLNARATTRHSDEFGETCLNVIPPLRGHVDRLPGTSPARQETHATSSLPGSILAI